MEHKEQEVPEQVVKSQEVNMVKPAGEEPNLPPTNQNKEQSELLLDFSSMFKTTNKKKPFKPLGQRQEQNKPNNWLLQIPVKVDTTLDDLKLRKVFDLSRWYCIIRLQSQLLSALVSIFNYLFSHKGHGATEPITGQEISKGSLEQRFEFICKQHNVKGRSRILKQSIQQALTSGLKSANKSYIYCSGDQYLCPVGFQYTPNKPLEAYKKQINQHEAQLWLILADTAKSNPVFSVRKWKDIKLEEGQHFIVEFQKLD